MELGVAIFATDVSIRPDVVARAAEEHGFASLWVPEHTHLPVDHASAPGGRDLPEEYRRTLDPFVSLTAAAAATEHIRLGTAICLVAQRDPFVTAKAVASLDHLSGGRFEFGVGYGWVRPEIEHHGVAFGERRDVLRDRILAMRALWTEEEASHDGEHVSFSASWAWPKPLQRPHPPILIGAGLGPRTRSHLVEFADGWMPVGRRTADPGVDDFRAATQEAGRDLSMHVLSARPDPGELEHLAGLGADRAVFWLPSAEEEIVLERLDELAALLDVVG